MKVLKLNNAKQTTTMMLGGWCCSSCCTCCCNDNVNFSIGVSSDGGIDVGVGGYGIKHNIKSHNGEVYLR